MELSLILYSRSKRKDYRWIICPDKFTSSDKDLFRSFCNYYDSVKETLKSNGNQSLPFIAYNLEHGRVIARFRYTERKDSHSRQVWAMEGLYFSENDKRDYDYLLPYLLINMDSYDMIPNELIHEKNDAENSKREISVDQLLPIEKEYEILIKNGYERSNKVPSQDSASSNYNSKSFKNLLEEIVTGREASNFACFFPESIKEIDESIRIYETPSSDGYLKPESQENQTKRKNKDTHIDSQKENLESDTSGDNSGKDSERVSRAGQSDLKEEKDNSTCKDNPKTCAECEINIGKISKGFQLGSLLPRFLRGEEEYFVYAKTLEKKEIVLSERIIGEIQSLDSILTNESPVSGDAIIVKNALENLKSKLLEDGWEVNLDFKSDTWWKHRFKKNI